ncbi:hypothetical protein [Rhizobium herbae]|uniref:Uncharacterized protein n=1 Tax=Rhizobium herbae TaxID=508661 RepID=A0ABS4EHJ1_9HYPH|nr:hypothetical protein [Rhizobium herbae]MBP1857407.1 hypothetical protein [Rhizobium herbae]
MSGIFLDITLSSDGFAAGPDICRETPLGGDGWGLKFIEAASESPRKSAACNTTWT